MSRVSPYGYTPTIKSVSYRIIYIEDLLNSIKVKYNEKVLIYDKELPQGMIEY